MNPTSQNIPQLTTGGVSPLRLAPPNLPPKEGEGAERKEIRCPVYWLQVGRGLAKFPLRHQDGAGNQRLSARLTL
ncbi:MAG: hypothetical protein GC158_14495 [Cyanobacteria bacterium RI_101]|nr:hypothetical protein [Cyanobacteria bacterium RI_101]